MPSSRIIILYAFGVLVVAAILGPIRARFAIFGVWRGEINNLHGSEALRFIPGTVMCEDVHLEETTGFLFTACQDNWEHSTRWFPPNLVFTDPTALGRGAIVRIDPKTLKSTSLELKGWNGAMVAHGIDILNDPEDPQKLWIYIVSHLPNPERYSGKKPRLDLSPERPHVGIFSHVLGTDEARYERSVRHSAIRTPNDLLAVTPLSFWVTNDHQYHEGLMRTWEDIATQRTGPISDTVFIQLESMSAEDPSYGVRSTLALQDVHNNNGLGRGPCSLPEIDIVDATGGVLVRAKQNAANVMDPNLKVLERIQLDSTLDNPSYYHDLWATPTNNASGYIMPGVLKGLSMLRDFPFNDRPIPSCVWHVRSNSPANFEGGDNSWEKRLIFADDGRALRTASGAVLVGIDPAANEGRKQGWLFVTGFGSFSAVAAKIDL